MKNPIRSWRRSPGFAVSIALVVALVVLANATVFAAIWGVLYKDLPYRDAHELVELRIDLRDIDFQVGLSPSMHAELGQATDVFAGAIGSAEVWQPRLDESGNAWRVQRITPDFTQVLGVGPARGQGLSAADDARLLLSDKVWRSRYAADPDAIGKPLRIGTATYVVARIMPEGFGWPDSEVDAWTPYIASAAEREQEAAGGFGVFHVAARLAPGATVEQARARLDSVLRNSSSAFLRDNPTTVRADVRPWRERFTTGTVRPLLLLQGAALLLLVVAAANIANLTVERITANRSALSVRRALGAQWRHVVQVVLADLLFPAAVGLATGLALAMPVLQLVKDRGLLPDGLMAPIGADLPFLAAGLFAAATVVLVAAAAGLLAAARGADRPGERLRAPRSGLLRAAMLVSQVAIATALCGSAGLLLRSALAMHSEDRGFDASGVLLTQIDLTAIGDSGAGGTAAEDHVTSILQRLRESIERQPGVTHVALADMPPFGGAEFKTTVSTAATSAPVEVRVASVDGAYFDAMGIPLLAGRSFLPDRQANVVPIVVDELFRNRWLPATAEIGSTVRIIDGDGQPIAAQVVGIASAVKQRQLSEAAQPMLYLPIGGTPAVTFLVTRTQGNPAALADVVRRELQRIAPGALLMVNAPLADTVWKSTAPARSLTEMAVLLGATTGLLSALGCFAVLGAAANRRRGEVGLRMALGATRQRVERMVLRQGAMLVVTGVGAGVFAGLLLAGAMADRLYSTSASDTNTWLIAAAVVAALALFACWLPARRASRVPANVVLAEGVRQL